MRLTRRAWESFRSDQPKRPKWLLERIIQQGSIGVCHVGPGDDWSWFVEGLAFYLAGGKPFLGFSVPQPSTVAYALSGAAEWDAQRRIKRIEGPTADKTAASHLHLITPTYENGAFDLETEVGQQEIERALPAKTDLLILPVLGRCAQYTGGGNRRGHVERDELISRLATGGTAVLLVQAGFTAGGKTERRAREVRTDYDIFVFPAPDKDPDKIDFVLRYESRRSATDKRVPWMRVRCLRLKGRPVKFVITEQPVPATRDEEIRYFRAMGIGPSEIARRLNVDRSTVHRALREPAT